jgi:hypothetical protein
MAWYGHLILWVVIFLAGFLASTFFFKNNPRYLNFDKMGKSELLDLYNKVKGKVG